MNQKKIIIWIFSTLTLIVVGSYVFWEKNDSQQKQIAGTIDQAAISAIASEVVNVKDLVDGEYDFVPIDTSDWQIYKNKEFGYFLKFPKSIKNTDQQSFVDDSGRGISFYIIPYDRLKKKQLDDVSEDNFLDSSLASFVKSGSIDVSFREKQINDTKIILVEYFFKKEPQGHGVEAWSEGGNLEEVFFQCGSDICAIRTISDQFLQERKTLFYTIISTLRLVK